MGGDAVEAPGADDGSGQGMDVGAPERAEAVGDLAEDDAGPECAFGTVVRGRSVAIGHEGEELAAPSFGLTVEFGTGLGDCRHGEQAIEPTVGGGAIVGERGVLQRLSPSSDRDGPTQEAAERWRELGFTGVDGVLDVAQDMGKADLVGLGAVLLGGPSVGHPTARPMLAQHAVDHIAAARGADAVQDGALADQHPFPAHAGAEGIGA